MMKLTKPCLTGNTRNKLTTFYASTWEQGHFLFSTFQDLDNSISRNIQEKPCRFIWEHNKEPTYQVSLKYTKLKGLGENLSITSFLRFSKLCFLKLNEYFLQGIMGKI